MTGFWCDWMTKIKSSPTVEVNSQFINIWVENLVNESY